MHHSNLLSIELPVGEFRRHLLHVQFARISVCKGIAVQSVKAIGFGTAFDGGILTFQLLAAD